MRRVAPWLALAAPTFPVLVFSTAARVATGGRGDPELALAPLSVLYGLWNMAASGLAALWCARQALRWGGAADDRGGRFALALCGVCGLVPWSVIVSTTCLHVALGDAWTSQGPLGWWRDWVATLLTGFSWPVRPTSGAFWVIVGPGLAITAAGLLLAARFIPAGARGRFFLLWCPVLAVLVSVVLGMV